MPNIEMYGYDDQNAFAIREQIREVLEHSSEPRGIVIANVLSDVRDLKGNRRPFLRIIAAKAEVEEMKSRLVHLNEDIEIILLHEWIEHK